MAVGRGPGWRSIAVCLCGAALVLAACTSGSGGGSTDGSSGGAVPAVSSPAATEADGGDGQERPPPAPDPETGPIELTRFGGCHDVTLWASNDDATIAVVVRAVPPSIAPASGGGTVSGTEDVMADLADASNVQVDLYVGHGLDHVACSLAPHLASPEDSGRVVEGAVTLRYASLQGDPLLGGPDFGYGVTFELAGLRAGEWALASAVSPMIELGGPQQPVS